MAYQYIPQVIPYRPANMPVMPKISIGTSAASPPLMIGTNSELANSFYFAFQPASESQRIAAQAYKFLGNSLNTSLDAVQTVISQTLPFAQQTTDKNFALANRIVSQGDAINGAAVNLANAIAANQKKKKRGGFLSGLLDSIF